MLKTFLISFLIYFPSLANKYKKTGKVFTVKLSKEQINH